MAFYVERTRLRDRKTEMMLGAESKIGEVKVGETFATRAMAEVDAAGWSETGDWSCRIVEGRAPKPTRRFT